MDDLIREEQETAVPFPEKTDEEGGDVISRERDEYLDGWKRAKADLSNYKREEQARLSAVVKSANENLLREIIVVLDSFDVAESALGADDGARKGMALIHSQLEEILKRSGLEVISVTPGMTFNPSFHEAVAEIFSGEPPGTVAKELSRGYVVGGRVLRASRVILSKGPSEEQNNQ